jgi:hypothetical protein
MAPLLLMNLIKISTNKRIVFSCSVPFPYDSDFLGSSRLVYLDNLYCNEEKEIRSWSYDQQQHHNTHTIKRQKKCNYPDNSISYRTHRMWTLLAKYVQYVLHNLSWLWEHHNTKTLPNVIQRGTAMSASCRYCGNPIVFDDNILSKTGRHKPLNEWNHQVHDCPFSPYNKARVASIDRRETRKEQEFQTISQLKDEIANTNMRLTEYELQLIVRRKEA